MSQHKYSTMSQHKYSTMSQHKYSTMSQHKYSTMSQHKYSLILVALSLLLTPSLSTGSEHPHRVRRVIGGRTVESADRWPWLVSLSGYIPTYRLFGITLSAKLLNCGGSLIADNWVLTAAHCIINKDVGLWSQVPLYWTARMGDINRDADLSTDIKDFFGEALNLDEAKDWDITAERIFVHPEYNPDKTWLHDIALVKLTRRAPTTTYSPGVPYIRQVVIDNGFSPNFPADGASCMFKGWGCQQFGGRLENVARQVELVKVSDAACRARWDIDFTSRICAGDSYTGICQGDSGGPLVCQDGTTWVQVGIASFTSSSVGSPGVFTDVGYHHTWIQNILSDNS